MSTTDASALAATVERVFPLLPETPDIYPQWRRLVDRYDAKGRQVYDARLVAVMMANSVTHLVTMNPTHFRRFTEIRVVDPGALGGS
jgi:predicted nucleic acid-binding protein